MIFSSGSEGDPKGVVLSHFNIDSQIEAIGQVFHMYPTDRILDILPLFHSYRLPAALAGSLSRNGAGLPRQTPGVGNGGHAGRTAPRATVLFATPTFLNIYIRRCSPGPVRLAPARHHRRREAARGDRAGIRGHLRRPSSGGLRHDRVLTGRGRQRSRFPGAGLLSAGLPPRHGRPSLARCFASRRQARSGARAGGAPRSGPGRIACRRTPRG